MDTPATEAYWGIHGAETGHSNRLVFPIKRPALESRQRATVREFESHRFRQMIDGLIPALMPHVEAVEKPIFSRNFFSQSAALAALFCF